MPTKTQTPYPAEWYIGPINEQWYYTEQELQEAQAAQRAGVARGGDGRVAPDDPDRLPPLLAREGQPVVKQKEEQTPYVKELRAAQNAMMKIYRDPEGSIWTQIATFERHRRFLDGLIAAKKQEGDDDRRDTDD